ncbi:MAG: large subunit ribosomal protein [Candidatus Hydrogenedentes bacterium]|nr:large subunit ribosomal protein [Candidatus Hydrogenedentota bacterium]
MANKNHKKEMLERRRKHVRKRITGTPECPRLRIFRSLNHVYAQVIDDTKGQTLAASSSVMLKIPGGTVAAAKEVGKSIGEKAKAQGIERVCFDRGGCLFHGRVKALADGAREAGLHF